MVANKARRAIVFVSSCGNGLFYAAGFSSAVTLVTPEAVDVVSSAADAAAGSPAQTRDGNFFWSACLYFGWLNKKKDKRKFTKVFQTNYV